jgi:RNA polymerase sigma-70 factor (ECF subfamily)
MSFQRSDSPGDHGSSVLRTSASLIDGMREDDGAAWDRMVALYAPLVARWCRSQRLSEADAADVFQEVFQAVAAHIGRFHQSRRGDTFRGWLRTITRNKIHDLYRRRRREPQGVGGSEARRRMNLLSALGDESVQDSGNSVQGSGGGVQGSGFGVQGSADRSDAALGESMSADPAERTLFRRGLELIRREFEVRTWQAFWRTAVDGRATADVAAELGMSPGAVRVAKSRVLQRLRSELGDIAGSPRRGSEPA